MKQPIATFCSLALCLWGYQTGYWELAVPMVLLLEGREFVPRRWMIPRATLKSLHVLVALVWLLSIICLPPASPSPITYAARYQILKGLPIALFPLILVQTYGANTGKFYRSFFQYSAIKEHQFNLYYPYFGVCLLSASVTGGNNFVFLAVTLLLVTGVLWFTRSPRFQPITYYGLIGVALAISIIGAHQFYWLEANVRLPGLPRLSDLIEHIAFSWPRDHEWPQEPFDSESFEHHPVAREEDLPNRTQPNQGQEPELSASHDGDPPSDSRDASLDSPNSQPSSSEEGGSGSENGSASLPGESSIEQAEGGPATNSESVESSRSSGDSNSPNSTGGSPSEEVSGSQTGSGASASQASPLPSDIQQAGGVVDPETSQTRMGSIGSLQQSNAILFRVTPAEDVSRFPYPLRIREATYNQYQSGAWNAAHSKFSPKQSQGNNRWVLGDRSKNTLSMRISEVLKPAEGLVKLPVGTSKIEGLAVDSLQTNQYGAVSFQRKASRGQPLVYDVQFDPNQFLDSAPTSDDRAVPAIERKTLKTVLKPLNLAWKSESEKVQAISSFFGQDFQYSLELSEPNKNQTPLAAFLLDHRSGHCEYFASATSLMLRSVGIPARYVVGYSVSEYSPTEQQYIVRVRDAHAWVMAYVNGAWITIDTTPSSGASQERNGEETVEEAIAQSTPAQSPAGVNETQGEAGRPATRNQNQAQGLSGKEIENQDQVERQNLHLESHDESLTQKGAEAWSSFWTSIKQKVSKTWERLQASFERVAESLWFGSFILLGMAIALIAALVIWRLYRKPGRPLRPLGKRRFFSRQSEPEGVDYQFHHIEERLEVLNLQRNSSETPRNWLLRLHQSLPTAQCEALQPILDLQYRHRFDPQGIDQADGEKLQALIRDWLTQFDGGG